MIDLRNCDVGDLLADPSEFVHQECDGSTLIHADPPWADYQNRPGVAAPDGIYPVLSMQEIARHLSAAYDCAAPGARLALWVTWPLLLDWIEASRARFAGRWAYKTGGAWMKTGTFGVGYHWRGQSEPLLVYVKPGTPVLHRGDLENAHASKPTGHSEKPWAWQRAMLRQWTRPGDLVLDLYAGMAPLARACRDEGRDYVGAELDRKRWAEAMDRLGLDSGDTGKTLPMFAVGGG